MPLGTSSTRYRCKLHIEGELTLIGLVGAKFLQTFSRSIVHMHRHSIMFNAKIDPEKNDRGP